MMASPGTTPARSASAATTAARAIVADRLPAARQLGADLVDEIDDPTAFVDRARAGLTTLADPAYRAGQRLVAPGIGPTLGVRTPLLDGVVAGLRRGLRGIHPARALLVADALARDEIRELRWMAVHLLRWTLPDDPERAWQVLRRIGRDADDWITVDTLAGATAEGILREPYRWAELKQLVFSPISWERRLVGSTVANVPHVGHDLGRIGRRTAAATAAASPGGDDGPGHSRAVVERGLELVGQLIGDDRPEVQSALAWALRELAKVDPAPVVAFCRAEADRAAASADGNRARVLRDSLAKLPTEQAAAIRDRLVGIRRVPGGGPTSVAAATAAAFASAGLGRPEPEALT